jgi:integrase/recombinase XerD
MQPTVPAGSVVPATRLLIVRGFARYMTGIDPRTQVPPTGLIGLRRHRRPPFIYTDEQVLALIERTGIRQRLVGATYETLIVSVGATPRSAPRRDPSGERAPHPRTRSWSHRGRRYRT